MALVMRDGRLQPAPVVEDGESPADGRAGRIAAALRDVAEWTRREGSRHAGTIEAREIARQLGATEAQIADAARV